MLFVLKVSYILILSFCTMYIEAACGSVQNKRLNDQIVNPVRFFVNRESEARKILYNLEEYSTTSIVGLTNIGKTEIVRKYALLNKNRYDLIWFFDASLDLNEQFVTLAKKINQTLLLESQNKISEEAYGAKQEVMKYLTGIHNWLLVFDNLRLNQNSKLTDLINWKRNGHIIICSQDSRNLPNTIYVHKLTKEHALILLQKIFGKEVKNQEVLEKLIDIFDGYPGSIVRGALLLKENYYLSLDEYKGILSKSSNPVGAHMELVLNLLTDSDKDILKRISVMNNQNFSKSFLKIISNNPESVGENLYNLNRFGLIKNIDHNEKKFFEMHDAVRDSVLQFYTKEEIKSELTDIINKLNKIMPQGVTSRYAFISSDSSIKASLEVLLENAEKYKVAIDLILELRKNLIDHYVVTLDYYNVDKMKIWLEQKEENSLIKLNKISDNAKINYAWYLVSIGIYEDFAKSRFISALSYFNKANDAIKNILGQAELKSTILFQIAQTQVFGGNIAIAEKHMTAADNVIRDYPNADFDMGLYWFIKARIAFSKGNYKEALRCIDNNIAAEAHISQGIFTAPTYIQKSEILNFMKEYNKSYEIIRKVHKQEIFDGHADHEIHARILTQLSNAELGLGLKQEALNSANKACDIFQKEINQYNIDNIVNTDFAAALVAQGNALAASKKYNDAFISYNQAESIYFKRYGDNYNKMDDINYLLSQGAKLACTAKNSFWKKHFYGQLINNLNWQHSTRIIEVEKLCQKSGI